MYALVTGATSGIGLEIARILASRKINLIMVGRREDRLNNYIHELEQKYNIVVHKYVCDLSNINECKELIQYLRQYEDIEVAINSAGFGKVGYYNEISDDVDIDMINTNVTSLQLLTKFLADHMKKGHIVNVASIAGTLPGPYMASYGATKAYVRSYSLAMDYELRKLKKNVRIITVCPGPVSTEFHDVAGSSFRMASITAKQCAKKIMKAVDHNSYYKMIGFTTKLAYITSRILPMGMILRIEYMIQRKKKVK